MGVAPEEPGVAVATAVFVSVALDVPWRPVVVRHEHLVEQHVSVSDAEWHHDVLSPVPLQVVCLVAVQGSVLRGGLNGGGFMRDPLKRCFGKTV